jgi:ketosteroid isomerase-like protein
MRKYLYLMLLVSALPMCPGCQHAASSHHSQADTRAQTQIQTRLDEIFDAASKKDLARLEGYHLYGQKFSKFAPEAPLRLDAEAARKGENTAFTLINDFTARAKDLKIDVFGNTAIATFVMDYSFRVETNSVNRKALATLVFVKDHGEWRITHEHISVPKE